MRYPEDPLAIESVNLCNLSALVVSAKESDLVGPPNRFPIRKSALCFHQKIIFVGAFFFPIIVGEQSFGGHRTLL